MNNFSAQLNSDEAWRRFVSRDRLEEATMDFAYFEKINGALRKWAIEEKHTIVDINGLKPQEISKTVMEIING